MDSTDQTDDKGIEMTKDELFGICTFMAGFCLGVLGAMVAVTYGGVL